MQSNVAYGQQLINLHVCCEDNAMLNLVTLLQDRNIFIIAATVVSII
jgi:hypothetical protein